MSIYYALIANKKDNVICEFTDKSGNFQQISRELLRQFIDSDANQVTKYQNYNFHSINENGLTFLSLSDGLEDNLMMSFLRDVQQRLITQYDWEFITSAGAYKLEAFQKQIKELIEYYETNPRQSVTGAIIKELSEVKKIIVKNIENLMDRENTLELTVNNSDKLKVSATKTNNFVRLFIYKKFFIKFLFN